MYKTIYTEVDVDLADFDPEDLLEELASRGASSIHTGGGQEMLRTIYEKRRLGVDYQRELDQLIWSALGKVL